MNQNFIHTHIHCGYSILDGLGSPKQYAERAAELGFSALAITDHGSIDGAIKFQTECDKFNIKSLKGIEAYIVKDVNVHERGEKRGHITLLAKNKIGWMNILQLVSRSNLEGFYYRPRIQPEWLLEHQDGLVIMSACTASFLNFVWGNDLLFSLMQFKKDDIYLEVMPHNFPEQIEWNHKILELSKKHGLKIIASNDSHYINKDDEKSQEVLLAVQTNQKWENPDRWKFKGSGYYLRTRTEMAKAFRKQGVLTNEEYRTALTNTLEVAEKCQDFRIEKLPVELPQVPMFGGKDDNKILMKLCEEGFKEKIQGKKDEIKYRKRFEEELEIIIRQGFARYFLIVWELINWCESENIFCGYGRGSSGSSLICYLLNITKIDPIEFNLLFARFIDPSRVSFPDIDCDFEDIKRPLIRKHLEELYGQWSVAGISTFSEMRGRGAIRDVSRVFSVPLVDVGKATSAIVSRLDGEEGSTDTIEDAFNTFEEGIAFKKKYPEVTEIAIKLEGQIRGKGQHAAGIIISDEDLRDGWRCAYSLGKDKEPIVCFDKDDIEYIGLMKLDVLGLKMLTVINSCREMVKKNHNIDIDYTKIQFTGRKIFREFSKGNNIGCFQVGSPGLRKFCQRLGIDNFMDLVHVNALFRPGPLRSGMSESYIKRKHGEEEIPQQHPIIDKITKDTYGVLIYQEQVMQLVHELAGLDWKVADAVRKVMAKSKGETAFKEYEDQFVEGCVHNKTISEDEAHSLWNNIASAGSYLFNKAHSCVYSAITFLGMWYKLNYSIEYICALLTYGTDKQETRDEYIEEAFRLGLEIRPPKMKISTAFNWVENKGVLYAPFIEIKGVGEKTATGFEKIGKEKKGFYEKDNKKEKGPVSSKFLKILDTIDAYNDIGLTDAEADGVSQYLGISLVKNRLHKYKKLMQLLQSAGEFSVIKDISNQEPDRNNRIYFGEITEIKLGYRQTDKGSEGTAYGTIKDDTGYTKISFSEDLYKRKKVFIQHCEGELILVKANRNRDALVINDAWFMSDIISGELEGLCLELAVGRRFRNKELLHCQECEYHSPVMPSTGSNNIMVIGEGPGINEEKEGKGFVGDAGVLLWGELAKYGFIRKDFNVSNVIKCNIKNPSRKDVNKCRSWLEEEIHEIQPFIILAMGNTNIKFFTEEDSGIMQKSGTTEWNEKYGAWICYCVHPASVLYSPENRPIFEQGIKNFCRKTNILGFCPF